MADLLVRGTRGIEVQRLRQALVHITGGPLKNPVDDLRVSNRAYWPQPRRSMS